jgi:hypothetical protein
MSQKNSKQRVQFACLNYVCICACVSICMYDKIRSHDFYKFFLRENWIFFFTQLCIEEMEHGIRMKAVYRRWTHHESSVLGCGLMLGNLTDAGHHW